MTLLPSDSLDLAILLWKKKKDEDVGEFRVKVSIPDDWDFDEIELKLNNADLLVSVPNRQQRELEFRLPSRFFTSMDGLVSTSKRRVFPPERFYLADCDYLYSEICQQTPEIVLYYFDATKLYSILSDAANYTATMGDTRTLIFLQKEKLEITPDYTTSDLQALPNLDAFRNDFIYSDTHKEQKFTIIRTVISEIFKDRVRVPFSELLCRYNDFIDKVNSSYQLYVSEFSFQKVKAEIEKEKLDAIVKLNKVFSDIQNQLLAVPAALLLVGSQLERTNHWSGKNLTIWLGSLIFAILMALLVRNQRHTLCAVKQEIDQQWIQIKGKYSSIADLFEDSYNQIEKRYKHQQMLIKIISLMVAISLAVSTCMLLFFSVPYNIMVDSLKFGITLSVPISLLLIILGL
jgi:hypothetical protein